MLIAALPAGWAATPHTHNTW